MHPEFTRSRTQEILRRMDGDRRFLTSTIKAIKRIMDCSTDHLTALKCLRIAKKFRRQARNPRSPYYLGAVAFDIGETEVILGLLKGEYRRHVSPQVESIRTTNWTALHDKLRKATRGVLARNEQRVLLKHLKGRFHKETKDIPADWKTIYRKVQPLVRQPLTHDERVFLHSLWGGAAKPNYAKGDIVSFRVNETTIDYRTALNLIDSGRVMWLDHGDQMRECLVLTTEGTNEIPRKP